MHRNLPLSPAATRFLPFAVLRFAVLRAGACSVLDLRDGQLTLHDDVPAQDCAFTISAPDEAWEEFSRPLPRPGFHDLFAMIEGGHANVEGDMLPFFRHQFLVKAALASLFGKEWT